MKSLNKGRLILAAVMAIFAIIGAQQVFASGKPWIGIYMQDVTPDLADAFNLSVSHGVVINDVAGKSPADKAGLKPKDVVLAWNGKDVTSSEELTKLVGNSNVGDDVKLSINRGGKKIDVDVQIGERAESFYSYGNDDPRGTVRRYFSEASKTVGIGVSMQSLSGKLGNYFGVPDGEGALITDVLEDTPAEKAGLKVGDVIVQVDREKVEGPGDVSSIIRGKEKGDKVDLVVMRDKAETTVTLEVDEIESFGWTDPTDTYLQYFNRSDREGRTPMLWFQDDGDTQRKMEELQSKLEEMQRKLDQLESKMK